MFSDLPTFLFMIAASLAVLVIFLVFYAWYLQEQKDFLARTYADRESELRRKIYEAAILRRVNERVSYSLDFEKIIEIISGSLKQLLPYSTISYLLLRQEKILYRVQIEEEVGPVFLDGLKNRSLESLVALVGPGVNKLPVDEVTTGRFSSENTKVPIRSYFNLPLVVNQRVQGLLTIASTQPSLYQEEDMTILYQIINQSSTALTRLETLVEGEKSKITSVIESLSDGVMMITPEYEVILANPAARLFLGNAQKITLADLVSSAPNPDNFRKRLKNCLDQKQAVEPLEVSTDTRCLEVSVTPVILGEEVLGAVALLRDRTKEKELEQLREQFTTMVIHDLRTPLTVIFGSADILLKRSAKLPQEKFDQILTGVKQSSQVMLDQVSNLLDVAKIEAQKWQVNKRPSDLLALLRSKYEYFTPLAKERGLKFQLRLPAKLEPVSLDEAQISRVLDNLLGNAFKFTSGGSVTLGLTKTKKNLELYVTDTGPGIPTDQQKYLFSKFGQLKHTLNSDHPGTGLGLVIAKGIVAAHQGHLTVESQVGHGTTFRFTLPL